MSRFPKSTVCHSKRLIGHVNGCYSDQLHQQTFSPGDISAILLSRLKEAVQAHLGVQQLTARAVICVPVHFSTLQRAAVHEAATCAGFQVLRIMSESSAAALVYTHKLNFPTERLVLLFDLGGGSLNVALVAVEDVIVEMRAVFGDASVGGVDFDERLVQRLLDKFESKHERWLWGKKDDRIRDNARAMRRLRSACEEAKNFLSTAQQTVIELDALHDGKDFSTTLTRNRFEELSSDLFNKCTAAVDRVLRDSNVTAAEVADVVLLGGASRIPKVQALLCDMFPGKALCKSLNVDETVASGAALQAAVLAGVGVAPDVLLLDVVPYSLGVDLGDGAMSVMLARNTTIPALKAGRFTTHVDNQECLSVKVYEGDPSATNNVLLSEYLVSGIPRAPAGVPQFTLKLDVDAMGDIILRAGADPVDANDRANFARVMVTKQDMPPHRYVNHNLVRSVQSAVKSKATGVSEEFRDKANVSAESAYQACARLKNEGNKLHGAGQYLEAARTYQRARNALPPEDELLQAADLRAACTLNLSSCYLQLQRWQACIVECNTVLEGEPNSLKALYRRGQAHAGMESHAAAVDDLTRAAELARGDSAQHDLINGKLLQARAALAQAAERRPPAASNPSRSSNSAADTEAPRPSAAASPSAAGGASPNGREAPSPRQPDGSRPFSPPSAASDETAMPDLRRDSNCKSSSSTPRPARDQDLDSAMGDNEREPDFTAPARPELFPSRSFRVSHNKPESATTQETLASLIEKCREGAIFSGRYQLTGSFVKGGDGIVCCATHIYNRTRVAIKLFADVSKWQHELQAYRSIHSQHVARLEEAADATAEWPAALVLEWGKFTLADWLSRGRLSALKQKVVLNEVLQALVDLHARNMVHNDLKPANIMWFDDSHCWKLVDLGNWTHANRPLRAPFTYTLGYAAPELIHADAENASCVLLHLAADMWAFGMIAYEVMTGVPFFCSVNDDSEVYAMLAGSALLPTENGSSVMQAVDEDQARRLVQQVLQRDPASRWTATRAMGHAWFRSAADTAQTQATWGKLHEQLAKIQQISEVTAASLASANALICITMDKFDKGSPTRSEVILSSDDSLEEPVFLLTLQRTFQFNISICHDKGQLCPVTEVLSLEVQVPEGRPQMLEVTTNKGSDRSGMLEASAFWNPSMHSSRRLDRVSPSFGSIDTKFTRVVLKMRVRIRGAVDGAEQEIRTAIYVQLVQPGGLAVKLTRFVHQGKRYWAEMPQWMRDGARGAVTVAKIAAKAL